MPNEAVQELEDKLQKARAFLMARRIRHIRGTQAPTPMVPGKLPDPFITNFQNNKFFKEITELEHDVTEEA